jgi:hypothetical protein
MLPLLLAGGASSAGSPPPALSVQSPGKGRLSLAVYNERGMMIRGLLHAQPVGAGPQSVEWDGTTQLGLPAAPGDYRIRGIWFPEPPKIDYLMKIGNSGNPPWNTPVNRGSWGADNLGSWGGNLGPATSLSANSKNVLAVFYCVESPDVTGIQLMDLDGNIVRRFTGFYGWDRRIASVMDEENFYLALFKAPDASGKNHNVLVAKYDLAKPPRGKIIAELPAGEHAAPFFGPGAGRWHAEMLGLAIANGRLYAPLTLDDKLFVIDAGSGKTLHTVSIPSPRGVAARDGRVFLISGGSLLRLTADGAIDGPPVITGLDDPQGMAIDADGNFLIAEGGAAQQVRTYTPAGKPLRQLGIAGGRPRSGVYDPAGMLDPRAVCAAPDGKIWVTSGPADFQGIAIWPKPAAKPAAGGKPLKEFFNMTWSSGMGLLTPDLTEMLATHGNGGQYPGLSAYKIDWEAKTWKPSWHVTMTRDMMSQEDVFVGYPYQQTAPARFPHFPYLGMEKGIIKADNGRHYITGGFFSIWHFDPQTKAVRLASFVSPNRVKKLPDGRHESAGGNGPNNWFAWADRNGDGRMARDEVSVLENPPALRGFQRFFRPQLQPDLSILFMGEESRPKPAPGAPPPDTYESWSLYRLPPREVLPDGTPVYDWNDIVKILTPKMPAWNGGDGYKNPTGASILDGMKIDNGSLYIKADASIRKRPKLTGVDGDGWWASRNWRMSPMKFDLKTGESAWLKLGSRAPGVARPGQMYYPGWGVAGPVDGVIYLADTLGQVWSWTTDGLYLGAIYNDPVAKPMIMNADSILVELIGTFVYKVNGKTYILTGDHGVSVHEVILPKFTPVDAGTLTLTPAMAAAAKPWDPDGPPPGKRPVQRIRSIFDFEKKAAANSRTITVDGNLSAPEWAGIPAMDLLLDGEKTGALQVTFDNKNLYLAYTIDDPNGLRNDGHELPYAPYVTGAYVDFVIGRDWSDPDRAAPLEGDVRVILARITDGSGSDYQMGFWPVRKDLRAYAPQPKRLNPQEIVSPVQQRHFDDISPVPGLVFAHRATQRGYTLEVSVPLASLGISLVKNPVIGFDASVAFADPAGQVRSRATHWAGESETVVVDRPGAAELKPSTWGTLEFDRTPLPPPPAE